MDVYGILQFDQNSTFFSTYESFLTFHASSSLNLTCQAVVGTATFVNLSILVNHVFKNTPFKLSKNFEKEKNSTTHFKNTISLRFIN